MTTSRWLAVLVLLAPVVPPLVYGTYVMSRWDPAFDAPSELQRFCGHFASTVYLVCLIALGGAALYGWLTLIIWLWREGGPR